MEKKRKNGVGGYKLRVKSKKNCENVKKDVDLNRFMKKKISKIDLITELIYGVIQKDVTYFW